MLLCRLVTGTHLFFCCCAVCVGVTLSLLLLTVSTLSASFLSGLSALIPRLNVNKETSGITTTEAHTVPDDNRVRHLYDNSTPTPNTTTTKDLHTDIALTEANQDLYLQKQTFNYTVVIRMDGRTLLFLCVAVIICAGETEPEKV